MGINFFNKDEWNTTKPFPERAVMEQYLKSHFRYWTLSGHNRSKSYANDVKIHHIGLTQQELDKAFDFIQTNNSIFNFDVEDMIKNFTAKFPFYTVGFNGASNGYLVLYKRDYAKDSKLVTYPGQGIDEYLDDDEAYIKEVFAEMDDKELQDTFELVKEFDTLCDDIRIIFINYLHSYKIRNVTVLKPTEEKIAYCPDYDDIEEGLGEIMNHDLSEYNITVRYDAAEDTYIAAVPSLNLDGITGCSLEQAIMWAEKSIIDHIENNTETDQ